MTDYGTKEIYTNYSELQLKNFSEPAPGIFIAESSKVVTRALDAGYAPLSLLLEKSVVPAQQELIERCRTAWMSERERPAGEAGAKASNGQSGHEAQAEDFPVYIEEFEKLKSMVGYNLTGGVLCAMRRRSLPSVTEVCAGARRIAVLENVVNPTNIGAIFRSAAALGIDAVLLTLPCCDPLYRRAVRVSMGNVFLVPWTYLRPLRRKPGSSDNHWESIGDEEDVRLPAGESGVAEGASPDRLGWPDPWLGRLRAMGFTTAAMALDEDSISVADERLKRADKLAIILGTEGDGLSEKTIAGCDYTVKIPMAAGVDSLNVAAASAVAFWEMR